MATNAAIKLQIGATGPAGPSPSGTQNLVLATPNGSSGVAVLRALVAADLPFTPINKAGDTGVGNLAMGALSATTVAVSSYPPAAGSIGYDSTANGLMLWSKSGPYYDFSLVNPGNTLYIMYVPTGTVNMAFAGTVTALQLTTTNGYVSSATGNLILTPPGANSIYMNYGGGSGGVKFCDGGTAIVASISATGALTAASAQINTYLDIPYGGYGAASLNANSTALANFRGSGHVQIAIACEVGNGNPVSLQVKHGTSNGNAYPLQLNPLGGLVSVGTGGLAVNGTVSMGALTATTATTSTYTVAGLPSGSSGMRAMVTNALAPTYGAAVVGGGAVITPVYHDGVSWKVG